VAPLRRIGTENVIEEWLVAGVVIRLPILEMG